MLGLISMKLITKLVDSWQYTLQPTGNAENCFKVSVFSQTVLEVCTVNEADVSHSLCDHISVIRAAVPLFTL